MFRDVVSEVAAATVTKRDKIYPAEADQITDLYAASNSPADMAGKLRLGAEKKKVELSVIKQAVKNIEIVQSTLFEVIRGTSFIFTPRMSDPVVDPDTGEVITPAEPLWTAPSVPQQANTTLTVMYKALQWEEKFVKTIYDVEQVSDLKDNVDYIITKIVTAQDNGTGTYTKLRTALLA